MFSTETNGECCHSSATVENSESILSSVAESTTARASASATTNDIHSTTKGGHRRGPRRRPERRQAISYEVDLGVPASFRATVDRDWILTTSCTALWKHFLYARGLVPVPTNQLGLQEEQQQQRRLSSSQRKMLQTAEKIQKLQTDLEEILTHDKLHVSYVLLTLGASWVNPKEVYLIDFTGLGETKDEDETCQVTTTTITQPTCSQRISVLDENKENVTTSTSTLLSRRKKEYTLSTRLIRQVVQAECDAESELTGRDLLAAIQRMSADQLSVTVGVTDCSFDELYREETTRQQQASTDTSITGTFILPKVIVRRDFVLPLGKKGVLRSARIHVFDKDAEVPGSLQGEDGAVKEKEELPRVNDGITWLSLHAKVKGFRLPSSHPL
jgi:hypothetical protein